MKITCSRTLEKRASIKNDSKLEYSGILFGRERYQISEFQGHFPLFDFCRQLFPVYSVCEARVSQSDKRFRLRQEITFKTLLCFPNIHVLPSALIVKHLIPHQSLRSKAKLVVYSLNVFVDVFLCAEKILISITF